MEKNNQNLEFLQSCQWRKFQECVGRKTYFIENEASVSSAGKFSASIIEHALPIVGKYLYCPRWPKKELSSCTQELSSFLVKLIELAKKENAGWIRIEPENQDFLDLIKENIEEILPRRTEYRIVKAPHDMQPKEVFVLDISKAGEQLLAEMKSKTRYNIGIAKKKNVVISNSSLESSEKEKYAEAFLKLTKEMALRNGITPHPEQYYRKMIESLPEDMLKIYVAEYEGEIIVANLVLFFGGTATYLHGASSNLHRNVMAPFLLQWQAILDAKERGCTKYDFGGVKIKDTRYKIQDTNKWEGITNFKLGFSPNTQPVVFPGSYDIIVSSRKYAVYKGLQRAKTFLHRMRK